MVITQIWLISVEAETGYFGGRQAVKGEESQYSLTEALCLFWVPPWGLYLSPVTNIHIIDWVLYCRMAFLSPIIDKWLWKWYRGIERILFKLILYFFSVIFYSFCAFLLQHVWNVWKYLCGNHDYAKSQKEADFVLKKVRRPKIFFWRSAYESANFRNRNKSMKVYKESFVNGYNEIMMNALHLLDYEESQGPQYFNF